MKIRTDISLIIILGSLLISLISLRCFSAPMAVHATNTPVDYVPVPSAADLNNATAQLQARAAAGAVSPDVILDDNVHGAAVLDSGSKNSDASVVHAAASSIVLSPRGVPTTPQFNGVINLGIQNGEEALEIDGNIMGIGDPVVDCGTGLLPLQRAQITSRTSSTMDILISRNLLDRTCMISASGAPSFSFQLSGFDCSTWADLCPGDTVGVYQATATDGTPISIAIRNGPGAQDILTPADVSAIEQALASLPVDHLKNVQFIQYKSDFNPYLTQSDVGNGGGIYIGDLSFQRSINS